MRARAASLRRVPALAAVGALILAASAASAASAATAQDPPVVAIRGGTVLTMAGPPIQRGTVLMRGGKIAAVGADVAIPAGRRSSTRRAST